MHAWSDLLQLGVTKLVVVWTDCHTHTQEQSQHLLDEGSSGSGQGKQHDLPYSPEGLGLAPDAQHQQAGPDQPASPPVSQQQRANPDIAMSLPEADHRSHSAQAQHSGSGVADEGAMPASSHAASKHLPGISAAVSKADRQQQAPGQEADAMSSGSGSGTTISQAVPPLADAESPQPAEVNSQAHQTHVSERHQQDNPASAEGGAAADERGQDGVVAWQPVADFPVHSITEVACMKLLPEFLQDLAQVYTIFSRFGCCTLARFAAQKKLSDLAVTTQLTCCLPPEDLMTSPVISCLMQVPIGAKKHNQGLHLTTAELYVDQPHGCQAVPQWTSRFGHTRWACVW